KRRALLPRERLAENAQVALWPGCDALDKGEGDVLALLGLMERLGERHVRFVDTEAVCAGYPLLAAGHPEIFRRHAAGVGAGLAWSGMVVTSCRACVHVLGELYPAEGVQLAPEVKHASELIAGYGERVPAAPKRTVVYYHDPCYLARFSDVMEPPRRLL